MTSFEITVALRYLWSQRRNLSAGLIAIFSMLGVAVGTWLLIFVLSASNGFETEVKNQLIGRDAHFEVTQFYYLPIPEVAPLLDSVRRHPQVTAASPFIVSQAVFSRQKRFSGCLVYGIDPVLSQNVIGLHRYMKWGEYRFDSLQDSTGRVFPGVVMGYALAARLGLEPGDRCYLYVFDGDEDFGPSMTPMVKPFLLAGVFESGMYQFDESMAYVSLSAAQAAFGLGKGVTGVQARVRDPMQSGVIAKELEHQLGYPYTTTDWQEKNRTLLKWMQYEKVLMGLALGIIIIIAAFNIVSSLVMNVNDKVREIGILRAMGATRKNILFAFVAEGALIGLIGSTAGTLLGLLSCWAQMRFGLITLPGDVYFVSVLPVVPQAADILAVFLVTNALCVVAAVVPAVKAANASPVESIRHE